MLLYDPTVYMEVVIVPQVSRAREMSHAFRPFSRSRSHPDRV